MSDYYDAVMTAFAQLSRPLTPALALESAKSVLPPDKAFQFEQWWTQNSATFLAAYNARTLISA